MAVLRCREAFAFVDQRTGAPRVVNPGDLVDEKDPAVKGRAAHFESVDVFVDRQAPPVEQATAEPGEKRATRRPRKPDTAAKDAPEA